jgi:hypothetical protein
VTAKRGTFRRIDPQCFRERIVSRLGKSPAKFVSFILCDTRREHMLSFVEQTFGDGCDRFNSFPSAKDHLGKPTTPCPVQVDGCRIGLPSDKHCFAQEFVCGDFRCGEFSGECD